VNPANASPGSADRAAERELRVEIRDADGRLLRTGTLGQAEALVAAGARWYGSGRRAHVRLNVSMPPNSLVTLYGQGSIRPASPGATYHHNRRGCNAYRFPREN
jgi:hypothetical protein